MTSIWHDTTVGAMQSVVIELLDTMNNMNVRSQRKMRDSGVAWIGEVPEGWTIGALKHYGSVYNGREIANEVSADDSNAIPVYGSGGVFKYTDKKQYEGAAVLFGRKGTIGRPMFVNGSFATVDTMYYSTYDRDRVVAKYIYHLLSSFDWQPYATHTAVPSLVASDVFNLPFCFPPLPEQQAIADYLDCECGKIDELRAKIEAQIADLATYKKSVITEAVTGKIGVDGRCRSRKMEASGVEWIGDIPDGWKVKRLRFLGKCVNGLSKAGEFFGHGLPFISYGDVYKNYSLPKVVNGLVESTVEERNLYSVERGDVFFTRTSETIDELGTAATCLSTIPSATFAGFLIRFRPGRSLHPEFSKFFFRASWLQSYFMKTSGIVTRASLSQSLLKNLPVLLPPLSEQREIADYLDKKCAAIDAAVAKCRAQLEDLAAYKKSLIFECVTGKKEIA